MEQDYDLFYKRYTRKRSLKIASFVILIVGLLYLLLSSWAYSRGLREVVRCTDFKTQSEAQVRYLLNPVKYGNLDNNHDQIACNNLPHN